MSFDGTEGGTISLSEAVTFTKNHRDNNSGMVKAHFFGKDVIQDILDQSGCEGIRVYRGEKSDRTPLLVMVGADSSEDDLIGEGAEIVNASIACPPFCGSVDDLQVDPS